MVGKSIWRRLAELSRKVDGKVYIFFTRVRFWHEALGNQTNKEPINWVRCSQGGEIMHCGFCYMGFLKFGTVHKLDPENEKSTFSHTKIHCKYCLPPPRVGWASGVCFFW